MSAHYQIFHDTCYRYDSPVSLAQQLAHLWPRECEWQRCTEQQLLISPEPTTRRDEQDVFGNPLTRLAFERPHDELQVNARLTVEVLARSKQDHVRADYTETPGQDPNNFIDRSTVSTCAFSVIHDANPLGVEWLSQLLRQQG